MKTSVILHFISNRNPPEAAMGHDLVDNQMTCWGEMPWHGLGVRIKRGALSEQMLNARTEHIDHLAGKDQDSRLRSAWFGRGEAAKRRLYNSLLALAE